MMSRLMTSKKGSGSSHSFTATIQNAGGGGAFVEIPFDVEETFGRKRVPVRASIEGEEYRGTLVRMGSECHMLIILKGIREKIGRSFGDEVSVTIEEDREERTVELPADFAALLAEHPDAEQNFQKLSYTHRREYVQWIESAKREQTRASRLVKAVEMLIEGKKEP
jgi:hypothetical protein